MPESAVSVSTGSVTLRVSDRGGGALALIAPVRFRAYIPKVAGCTSCGLEIEARFRFCPWCGHVQRRKLVEFFMPHANSPGRALRVTRYVADDPHVRFSVWEDGVARAAVSITDEEAHRLADFLEQTEALARPQSSYTS